ncbi:MAG: bifunctional glutamate N-acetyltransferase/amino-acid acetyltransferase ArgJ [Lachnospiraceae bacterium]|nr:bifunctional glutamate N-acetyltransferase/amino-acid acetyltransferase ArgJ [Lachnospiraceae bacterium]
MINKTEGGVTAAKGFSAACTAAGIKYKDRTDMAMVMSSRPCISAGTYTKNVVKAAPVIFDRQITDSDKKVQAVVINAGIANACTGEEGMGYCRATADAAKKALGIKDAEVLVASTGVIGKQLPIDRIVAGTKDLAGKLSDTIDAGTLASKAIMTTDTKNKEIAFTFEIGGKTCTIGGMCKGSGMIHPNMCTMLGFITTDCLIDKKLMLKALRNDIEDTFNMVSVDGDTSTNDSVILLSNGLAENPVIDDENSSEYALFCEALRGVTLYMAKHIAADGEGATKLFEVKIVNAADKEEAKTLALSVVKSSLTKAAVYGNDANVGRIMCALGYSGVDFDPYKVDITMSSENGSTQLVSNGVPLDFDEDLATKILSGKEVTALCDMKRKDGEATAWGCDLTYDYVKINADYRS